MLKKIVALIAATTLLTFGLASPASSDSRFTLEASTTAVLNGTTATFTPGGSITEGTAYEWGYFKYEVKTINSAMVTGTAATQQTNATACRGITTYVNSSYETCSVEMGAGRNVYSAGANSSSVSSSTLKLTPKYGPGAVLKIRAWLDRDNDGKIDSFEPASNEVLLSAFDPATSSGFFNFQVEPPKYFNTAIQASLSAGSSALTVGTTGTAVAGLIDQNFLAVEVWNCFPGVLPCERTVISGTWFPHPQLQTLVFASTAQVRSESKITFNLYYNPFSDASLKKAFLLSSKTFDYTGASAKSAKTSITFPANQPVGVCSFSTGALGASAVNAYSTDDQRLNPVARGCNQFTYVAEFEPLAGASLVGQSVYVNVDLKDLKNPSVVKADGVSINTVAKDQVTLRRVIDKNNKIQINFTTPVQFGDSQFAIDSILGGRRAGEISSAAKEEVVLWGSNSTRVIYLSFDDAQSNDGSALLLRANLVDGQGNAVTTEKVIFGASDILSLTNASVNGGSSTYITVGPLADMEGQTEIVAQAITNTGVVTAKAIVEWNAYGLNMIGYREGQQTSIGGADLELMASTTLQKTNLQLTVKDKFGALAANKEVKWTYSGSGATNAQTSTTNELGVAEISIAEIQSQRIDISKLTATISSLGISQSATISNLGKLRGVLAGTTVQGVIFDSKGKYAVVSSVKSSSTFLVTTAVHLFEMPYVTKNISVKLAKDLPINLYFN